LGASSRKKKPRYGIIIRKNKQSEVTTEGLTSHYLNRTKSPQSNKVGQLQTIYKTAWKIKKDII